MKAFLVGPKGGQVDIVDKSSGEVVVSIPLPPGLHPVARFRPFMGVNHSLCGPQIVATHGNSVTNKPVGKFESAANPFFRVSPAQKQFAEIKRMMLRTEAVGKRTALIARAMKRAKAPPPVPPVPPVAPEAAKAASEA